MLGRVSRSGNLPKSRRWRVFHDPTTRPREPRIDTGVQRAPSSHNAAVHPPAQTDPQPCAPGLCVWPAPAWLRRSLGVSLLVAGLLGACAAPTKPPAPTTAVVAPAAPAPAAAPTATPEPAPNLKPSETAAPSPTPVAVPMPPPVDVPKALAAVRTMLDLGEAADAERDLQTILQAEPQNKEALSLLRQIREDPVAILGRESHPYRVAPGETLSSIAGRALKDSLLFYALARYNNIKVPRQVAAGQMIRVPGRALVPSAAGAGAGAGSAVGKPPVDATATGSAAKPADAVAAGTSSAAASTAQASNAAAAAAVVTRPRSNPQQIADFTRAARTCSQRQDPCCAVVNWDKVLELDAAHNTAKLEKQKEQDRIERLRKQGGNPGC